MTWRIATKASILGACIGVAACQRAAPPSRIPSARDAITRMRESQACSRGLTGEGSFDYLGDDARVRARSLYVVGRPSSIRFDVMSPIGGVMATLTSDGKNFAFSDLRERVFVEGPADECNVERALRVPIPPSALGELLTGQAPILVHAPEQASLIWDDGSYRLQIQSEHQASEEVRLVPRDEDWERPWREQRLRVIQVRVSQQGLVLYEAELDDHRPAERAEPRVDPDGIEPDLLPSGPPCAAEVPRRIRFVVPGTGRDIVLSQSDVKHNPPVFPGLFEQAPPGGARIRRSSCQLTAGSAPGAPGFSPPEAPVSSP